jgi:hypothetical protein
MVVLVLSIAVLTSGCAVNGLSFVIDDRVEIVRPTSNEELTLPLTVTWTVDDYDGYFAVFFDRSPVRPNQNLRSLVPRDDPCRIDDACPDEAWLAAHGVYVTRTTSLTIPNLADRRDSSHAKDRHDLTIVLLDSTGKRQGEAAFSREFIVSRER